MGQGAVWACGWGVKLTDYSKVRLYTHEYTQKIQIINNIGGNALRLRFSHVYGGEPVSFGKVSLQINDGAETIVTKDGRREITLEAFRTSYSDEVAAEARPGDTITIKTEYIENTAIADGLLIPDTQLLRVESSGELVCKGNGKYIRELCTIPDTFHWLVGICGLEVCTEREVPAIAFFGDSLTQVPYWVSPLMGDYYGRHPGRLTFQNSGISGNRLLHGTVKLETDIGNINGDAGIKRIEHDIFSEYLPKCVVILEGINDLIFPFEYRKLDEVVKSEDLIAGLKQCVEICEQYGSKAIACTLLPFKGHACWNGISERARQEVNHWIRAQGEILFIDMDAYAADAEDPRCLKMEWRDEGSLHLNHLGGMGLAKEIMSSNVMQLILQELEGV